MAHALSRVLGWAAVAAIIIGALVLRVPRLDQRPMHGDEANQAVRTGLLLDQGYYHYDPADHHGPTLYFAAWPFCRASADTFAGTTEWNFRLVPVTFSLLTLLLMLGLGSCANGHGLFVNRVGLYSAALLTVVSPAMVYYNRFFIQESMLLTFLTGMLLCAVRYASALSAPKPETRNQKPETRNPKPETRNPKPETRNPKPETRNPSLGCGLRRVCGPGGRDQRDGGALIRRSGSGAGCGLRFRWIVARVAYARRVGGGRCGGVCGCALVFLVLHLSARCLRRTLFNLPDLPHAGYCGAGTSASLGLLPEDHLLVQIQAWACLE
jgi:hypothetical protein